MRDDNRQATFLMNSAVTTYQAYNSWGGSSLYQHLISNPLLWAPLVSFDRPYDQGQGSGQFFDPYPGSYRVNDQSPLSWPWVGFEYPMVRFLERGLLANGGSYDVKYATDIDLHAIPILLDKVTGGFLSVGHDEYWSKEMHANLENERDTGTGKNIAFFSGNSSYWIITLHPNNPQGQEPTRQNRIIETHKDPGTPNPLTPAWNWANCSQVPSSDAPSCPGEASEQTLVGSITTDGDFDRGDVVFTTADLGSWPFQNAALQNGSRLPGMIGYEAQTVCGTDQQQYPNCQPRRPVPFGQTILATSQFKSHYTDSQIIDPTYPHADMSLYPAKSGAAVFSSGSPDWSLGLDIYTSDFPSTVYLRVHPAIAQITRNILHQFGDIRDPGQISTDAYSVSLVSQQGGTITVEYRAPDGRPQVLPPLGDFVTLYRVGLDDDRLVRYQPCYPQGRISGPCTFTSVSSGTYTADYVTLEKVWQPVDKQNPPPPMRTIWRAAKSNPIIVP